MALLTEHVLVILQKYVAKCKGPPNPANNSIPINPIFLWNVMANNMGDDCTNIPTLHTSMMLLTMGMRETGVMNQQNYPFNRYS